MLDHSLTVVAPKSPGWFRDAYGAARVSKRSFSSAFQAPIVVLVSAGPAWEDTPSLFVVLSRPATS